MTYRQDEGHDLLTLTGNAVFEDLAEMINSSRRTG